MPWNSSGGDNSGSGGSGGPRGPWGRPPSSGGGSGGGGGGMRPPDFEDFFRRGQEGFRRLVPGPGFGSGSLVVGLLIVVVIWLLSGIYFVAPYEQGIVLRFGRFVARTPPGINYHIPWPIETNYTLDVTHQRQINIGFRASDEEGNNSGSASQDVPAEAEMLTGDENIIDINFSVFWKIKDAGAFQFNVDSPIDPTDPSNTTIKAVAESAMREVVGRSRFDNILTQDREQIQIEVKDLMQKTLDMYGMGVVIINVTMQKVDPPSEVIDAYRDVQAARTDQDRARNEAETFANTVIPQARGNAARIVQDAEAYRQQVIAEAEGDSRRFLSILAQYRAAPDVTKRRMYLETMSGILGNMNKVIVDNSAKGVVPYFQLPSMLNNSGAPPAASAAPARSTPSPSPAQSQAAGQNGGQQ
jgi:modulator of FtsH protease HflK